MINSQITDAMNGIIGAIDTAAGEYGAATQKVTQMAQNIDAENVSYLQQTGTQAQQIMQPYITMGQQGAGTLDNVLGVNGSGAQQSAIQSMISSGNMTSQNMQTLSSIFGNSGGNPFSSVMQNLTGMANYGQATSNILNANPVDYANQLTQAGVNNAQNATNALSNNSVVQQELGQMTSLGQRATQNSAAANGMLNSGNTLSALYNQGEATAGQYLLPQMTSLANTVMGNTNSAGNAMLGQQGSLANQIVGSGTSLANQLANTMVTSNTGMAQNILSNTTSGLSSLAATGQQAAGTSASVLGNLGAAVTGQNSQMANTISNATMANAQNMGNAAIAGAQMQLQLAQMSSPMGGGGGW
jgi:hypothetical protein